MRKSWTAGIALIGVLALAGPATIAEGAKAKHNTKAEKDRICKADCGPDGPHGLYKFYKNDSWAVKTAEGRKAYNLCVQKCRAPLPPFYVQRPLLEHGIKWFGSTGENCLECHDPGPNLKLPSAKN